MREIGTETGPSGLISSHLLDIASASSVDNKLVSFESKTTLGIECSSGGVILRGLGAGRGTVFELALVSHGRKLRGGRKGIREERLNRRETITPCKKRTIHGDVW